MKPAERLLPGTDALKTSTIEATRHRGKILVRYRRPDGYSTQRTFTDKEQAHAFVMECTNDLRKRIRGAKP